MAINLSRNTKVYFTTNLDVVTGVPNSPPDDSALYDSSNTFEVLVQDGYTFGQTTQQQTISVNEGGNTAQRGTRGFNTQLDPVDLSFATYIRPQRVGNKVTPQERVLWNALFGIAPLDEAGTALPITSQPTRVSTTGTAAAVATVVFTGDKRSSLAVGTVVNFNSATNDASWNQPAIVTVAPTFSTNTTATVEFMRAPKTTAGTAAVAAVAYTGQWAPSSTAAGTFSYTSTMPSSKNQLLPFGMIFVVDNAVYAVDNCVMDSATIDFGLDAIAMVSWAAKGGRIRELTTLTGANLATSATLQSTAARYIANKLSTFSLQSLIGGSDASGSSVTYNIPITGGQLTIANNVTYLVPTNLGVVNQPITYFTGSRSITGNVTAYLKTGEGAGSSGGLYASMLAQANTTTEPKFRGALEMGGVSNAVKVEFEMSGLMLQIPTVDVQDVVSTTINFVAQGYNPNYNGSTDTAFDLGRANELQVKYYSE